MDCKVKIFGAGEDCETFGTLKFTDAGFRICYGVGPDECHLSVSGGRIMYSRRGAFNFDMAFEDGKDTECVLRDEGLTGVLPVKTLNAETRTAKDCAHVDLKYLLGGEERELILSAEAIQPV